MTDDRDPHGRPEPKRWEELEARLPPVGTGVTTDAPSIEAVRPPIGTTYQFYPNGLDEYAWAGPIEAHHPPFCVFDLTGDGEGDVMVEAVAWVWSEKLASMEAARRYARSMGWMVREPRRIVIKPEPGRRRPADGPGGAEPRDSDR